MIEIGMIFLLGGIPLLFDKILLYLFGLKSRFDNWVHGGLIVLCVIFARNHLWEYEPLFSLSFSISCMITWDRITKDYDPACNKIPLFSRLLLIICQIGLFYSPLFCVPYLCVLIQRLDGWTHHLNLPFRMFVALSLYSLSYLIYPHDWLIVGAWLFFLSLFGAHYVIPAFGKLWIGKKWHHWITKKHLHNIIPGAYIWGWMGFLEKKTVIGITKLFEKYAGVLQGSVVVFELLPLFALLAPKWAYIALLFASLTNFGIFIFSGIFFWQNMLTNLFIAISVSIIPPEYTERIFTVYNWVFSIFLIGGLHLSSNFWRPSLIAWWQSNFYGRMHMDVLGESGKLYSLTNDMLCPYEKQFGQTPLKVFLQEPVLTGHLGNTHKYPVWEILESAAGNLQTIGICKRRFGKVKHDVDRIHLYERVLRRHIEWMNQGKSRRLIPRILCFLKAPGGHLYYWGRHERFCGQERVKKLRIVFCEYAYTGEDLVTLSERCIKEISF